MESDTSSSARKRVEPISYTLVTLFRLMMGWAFLSSDNLTAPPGTLCRGAAARSPL